MTSPPGSTSTPGAVASSARAWAIAMSCDWQKLAQGWPKSWTTFRPLIGILSQKRKSYRVGPKVSSWPNILTVNPY